MPTWIMGVNCKLFNQHMQYTKMCALSVAFQRCLLEVGSFATGGDTALLILGALSAIWMSVSQTPSYCFPFQQWLPHHIVIGHVWATAFQTCPCGIQVNSDSVPAEVSADECQPVQVWSEVRASVDLTGQQMTSTFETHVPETVGSRGY